MSRQGTKWNVTFLPISAHLLDFTDERTDWTVKLQSKKASDPLNILFAPYINKGQNIILCSLSKTYLLYVLSSQCSPQGTLIIPNLTSLLNEEGQWKFPNEFNPENFLNDQGEFVKPEAFMPFSAGMRAGKENKAAYVSLHIRTCSSMHTGCVHPNCFRWLWVLFSFLFSGPRMCLGEGLARMELFLIMVTLLRKFKFTWPEDAGEPDYTPVYGVTLTPRPYLMKIEARATA